MTGSSYRVRRGGGWGNVASYCRSANRSRGEPALRYDHLGFRPARRVVPNTLTSNEMKTLKPTNEEKLQVVEAILQMGAQLDEAVERGDQKVLLTALLSSSRLILTALAMLLVEKTSAPSDPNQLLLFQDVDADEQPPQDGY